MLINLPRARNIMAAEGIDALILVTPINVLYASDLASEFMLGRFEDYTTAVVLPRDDSLAPSLVLPEFDLPFLIEAGSWIENVYCYGNPWSSVGLFMGESLEANLSSPLRKELQFRRIEQQARQEPGVAGGHAHLRRRIAQGLAKGRWRGRRHGRRRAERRRGRGRRR